MRAKITTTYSTNPIYDWGLAGSNGFVWWDRGFIEASQYDDIEQVIRVNVGCLLDASGLYFENSVTVQLDNMTPAEQCPFIDATEGGGMFLNHCTFNGTKETSLVLGGRRSSVADCQFANFPASGNPVIDILPGANESNLSDLRIIAPPASANDPAIRVASYWNRLSNIYLSSSGKILVSGYNNLLSGIHMYAPIYGLGAAAAGHFAIDFTGFYNVLSGALLDGSAASQCDAIRTNDSVINGVLVRNFAGSARGIVVNHFAQISGTKVTEMPGDDYVYTYGSFTFNQGTVRSATASAGAVTINAEAGLITTESLTTAAGSDYTLTMTNAALGPAANTQLMVSVFNEDPLAGGNTGGEPHVWTISHATGSATIKIRNTGSANFNGKLKIQFQVVNLGGLA